MKVLVLDNYDSFTYNLVHAVKKYTQEVYVFRNDEISLEEVNKYDKIILSPGPGIPDEANLLKPIIKEYASKKSIFGVCLGQQAIAEVFGGKLLNTKKVFHGVATEIDIINQDSIFEGLSNKIAVGRYHSWVVDNDFFPSELEVLARAEEGEIMAIRHKKFDVKGVQFHPESILTPDGDRIIKNWLFS
jgi:anthranilate synthase component 2